MRAPGNRRLNWLGAVVAAGALLVAAPAGVTARGTPGGPNPPQPVTTFPAGSFPESLAVRDGNAYVSLGFQGAVMKVTTSAGAVQTTEYASGLPIGDGLLTGIAFDSVGNLYVAAATFAADPAPGVFAIPAGGGSFSRVVTLPAGSFPNGLAFRGGELYVSDSDLGAIWRVQPTTSNTTLTQPWYESALIAPTRGLGANGIAFDATAQHLYVAVADSGRIVRLALSPDGAVSATSVVTEQEQLRTVDGISLDVAGDLYATVNATNRLYRLTLPDATLTRLANRSDGLSYPTQSAFDGTMLYLTNGAFYNGVADLEALQLDIGGLPLPR